ncbi:LysE family translocator [Denitromonas iodatirespirans]|uniref:LysE family translocator n=1 Tax=Denitromonas iodatirespirans TaxID=2795389 RepID=A0A944DBW3_DENI1|nr:LysE family translocator [Denitromonas iodatirespirans]MBT0963644.1 LysE family translocator [Denitromonas iodatirespirans]
MLDLLPLLSFVVVASITPGPNNIMLATAGASAGFRATVPHMLGISIGLCVQIALVGTGIATLMHQSPALTFAMRILAVGYLLWLALQLLKPARGGERSGAGQPLSFIGAALFQWINPKAWMMALTINAAFLPTDTTPEAAIARVALVAALVNLPCIACWAAAGSSIRRRLADPAHRRTFDGVMGIALAGTAVWLAMST